ncbi:MAG: TRAP transporter small permease subunit [Syntrophales bacterium]|nr:TRAP transporter small permease subunit [Syntrophales bacterium]
MNTFLGLSNKIDALSEWTGKVFSYLLIPLTLCVVFEVVTRSFDRPTIWTFEMSNFLYGSHFMLVAAYGLLMKSHVGIDLIASRFSMKTQAICSLICYACMYFPFIAVFTYFGFEYSYNSWSLLENSWSAWGPPLYFIKTAIPLTAVLLILQGISEVIKTIDVLVQEKEVSQ